MSDDDITYRLTIWVDDTEYDWWYTLSERVLQDRHRLSNKRVPVDDWPDRLQRMSTKDFEGKEFVASNDRGEGIAGLIETTENGGSVLVLDTDNGNPIWGEDFGDEDALVGPTSRLQPMSGGVP